jgi:hypothetical protein
MLCDEAHIGTYKCLDCNYLMCEFMSISHTKGKLTKNHRIEKLSLLKMKETNGSGAHAKESFSHLLCSLHNDVYKYYDHDCGAVICRDCYAFSHNGHRCVAIPDATNDFRELIESKITEVQQGIDVIKTSEANILEIEENLDKRFSELNEVINLDFRDVRNLFP